MTTSPFDAIQAFNAWKEEQAMPSNAWLSIHLNIQRPEKPSLCCTLYLDGLTNDKTFSVDGDDWDALLAAAKIAWEGVKREKDRERIRKMALDIIDLSDGLGELRDIDLRMRGWEQRTIERIVRDAIEEATELCSCEGFTVKMTEPVSNAA